MKWLLRLLFALVALLALACVVVVVLLRGSLGQLDGEAALAGLGAQVQVARDADGTVTVDANDAIDTARALGYVHAQERYFEMDLLRRSAAGELAALFGPMALPRDREVRVHRMRARVERDIDAIAGSARPLLAAYVDGVNAGLGDLDVRPWPYLLLGAQPQAWRLEDSALVGYAMFFDLQDEANRDELARWRMRGVMPDALFSLLTHDGSGWDAPLQGSARGDAVLPGPDVLDLRTLPTAPLSAAEHTRTNTPAMIGSNNFAVAGALTTDGRALVADDMHLGLRAPALWFRARLRYADATAPDGKVDVAGFTLPGLPAVIVGSNTHVAWGYTNSYGDWLDWVRVPADAPLQTLHETIDVHGAAPETLDITESEWGPVLHEERDGTRLALQWTAHLRGSLAVEPAFALHGAADVDDAVAIARRAGMPVQNMVVGDASGRIAWVPAGRLPARVGGCDPQQPLDPAICRWDGWLDTAALAPLLLIDPDTHRLWTANARVADGDGLRLMGDAGYDLGARQQQIRDAMRARDHFVEADLLALQLDDRALFLERWWQLLRTTIEGSDDPALQRLAAAAEHWDGRAAPDSVSYRQARGFRLQVLASLTDALLGPAKAALGDSFLAPSLTQFEGVAWPLLEQRPLHLLPPQHASWETLLADAARRLEADLAAQGDNLRDRTWGERNRADICHPLAAALPGPLRERLCMPHDALAGDSHMPRVAGPRSGASQRMVVSPGREADGIVQMPGGQSGHPLSPFWGAGHAAWVRGDPAPFLPGPTRYTLRLVPNATTR